MRFTLIQALLLFCALLSAQHNDQNLLTPDEAVSMAMKNNLLLQQDVQNKLLVQRVKSAYYNWIYVFARQQLYKQHLEVAADLNRVAELRYEAGDIDMLEKASAITMLAEINTRISMLDDELEITANNLKSLINTSVEIQPSIRELQMYQINKESLAIADSIMSTESYEISKNDLQNLILELNCNFKLIGYYETYALPRATLLLDVSKKKYECEEIDYLEYIHAVAEAFSTELDFLDTLNHYNQTAIQLEFNAY
jgi:outer membrane protein TolC